MENTKKIALVGTSNSGKSTLFNLITGLNQKIGNFHGVTVEKKVGKFQLKNDKYEITDLPGIQSVFASSLDEEITVKEILTAEFELLLFVFDCSNIRNNFQLLYQVLALKKPLAVVLNKTDLINAGQESDLKKIIQKEFGFGCFSSSENIKQNIAETTLSTQIGLSDIYNPSEEFLNSISKDLYPKSIENPFIILVENFQNYDVESKNIQKKIHQKTSEILQKYNLDTRNSSQNISKKIDDFLLHRIWGGLAVLFVLFFFFQLLFFIASYPMDWIEMGFGFVSNFFKEILPENIFAYFITDGLIPGITGVVVFLPQICLLFFFLGLLEHSGYLSRIHIMFDRMMYFFGLEGKSIIPMVSGAACAIPAIMSTRSISDIKTRNRTMMSIPLITCSARLPVFLLLISLLVEDYYYFGFISLKGILLFATYFLGSFFALIFSLILSLREKTKSIPALIELTYYKKPNLKAITIEVYHKAKTFVKQAGTVILVVSVFIWLLTSTSFRNNQFYFQKTNSEFINQSLAADMGKTIEPIIKPLGYDWKIGIAIITSFVAREVFVGTLYTIYGLESDNNNLKLEETLKKLKKEDGSPQFSIGTIVSLMFFFLFALQCVSTLSVLKKEMNSWKAPLLLWIVFAALAYIFAFTAFQILG